MKRQIFIALIAASCAAPIMMYAAVKPKMAPASAVTEVGNELGDILTDVPKVKVVKFFSPSCGHCTAAAPYYEKFASSKPDGVVFLAVNVDKHMKLAEKYGARGWPTFIFFDRNGRKADQHVGFDNGNSLNVFMRNGITKAGGTASSNKQAKAKQPAKTKTLAVRSK